MLHDLPSKYFLISKYHKVKFNIQISIKIASLNYNSLQMLEDLPVSIQELFNVDLTTMSNVALWCFLYRIILRIQVRELNSKCIEKYKNLNRLYNNCFSRLLKVRQHWHPFVGFIFLFIVPYEQIEE